MKNIMLDLETMGTNPDAAIIAIGAVEFSLETKALGREFYQVVDLESAMRSGGTVDASTILWWMQQSDEARGEFKRFGRNIRSVLCAFRDWLYQESGDFGLWGSGADFDNVILRSAYTREGLSPPWSHKQNRCFRTMRSMYPQVDTSAWESTKHNALSDAKWQARYLCEILGGKK